MSQDTTTIIYSEQKQSLFSFGCHSWGQLGLGGVDFDQKTPREISSLEGKQVLQLASGQDHYLAWTTEGLYGWGYNNFGELGLQHKEDVTQPTQLPFFGDGKDILQVYSGKDHCLVLTLDGLFCWGYNRCGQLGLGDFEIRTQPCRLEFFDFQEIIQISCNLNHCFVLTLEGLFAWGENKHGELGLGDFDDRNTPTKIDFFDDKDVLKIFSGISTFVTTSQGVYSWGENKYGQLGLGDNQTYNTPQKVKFFEGKTTHDIKFGLRHCLALTSEGLYSWGENKAGQLGLGHHKTQKIPRKVICFDGQRISQVHCNASHCFALTSKGLYSWGGNAYGQLGLGHQENQNLPQLISHLEQKEILQINCSFRHCMISTCEGVYAWGNNRYGQLGLGHQEDVDVPEKVKLDAQKQLVLKDQLFFQEKLSAHRRAVVNLLLCFRKASKQSVWGEDFLPLDMFKLILSSSGLTKKKKIVKHL